jgi:lysophospholipase
VWCLDWRGQGGSERPPLLPSRPRRRDFARDAADLAGFAGAMLPPGLPRLLIGHSMGGAIALLALQRHRGLFDAAILSAPMLGLPAAGWPPALARFLTRLADAAGLGTMFIPGARRWEAEAESGEQSRTTHDAERARIQPAWFAANPDLVVDGPTFGFVASAFGLVDRLAEPDFLAAIETPVLIGSPNIESFVDPASHRRAAAHLRNCRVFDMPGSKHEPFLESDVFRDRWLAAIDAFVAERLAKI